jgi:hypothetical protein
MSAQELDTRVGSLDGEEVRFFSMHTISVDDIHTRTRNGLDVYHNLMFVLKDDGLQVYEDRNQFFAHPDENDYLDDSKDGVAWSGGYSPVPYRYGEIDEEAWLRGGSIIGVDDPDIIYYHL